MKSLRSLIALVFAAALAGSLAHAADKKPDAKPAKSECGCEVGKDGKACGVDKDCCCTGEKAKGKPADKPKTK